MYKEYRARSLSQGPGGFSKALLTPQPLSNTNTMGHSARWGSGAAFGAGGVRILTGGAVGCGWISAPRSSLSGALAPPYLSLQQHGGPLGTGLARSIMGYALAPAPAVAAACAEQAGGSGTGCLVAMPTRGLCELGELAGNTNAAHASARLLGERAAADRRQSPGGPHRSAPHGAGHAGSGQR